MGDIDDNIEYSIMKIKILAEKINSIRDEQILKKIKNIIVVNNPSIEMTKNSNGFFIRFQNLKPSTYVDIEKIINKLERKKIKKLCKTEISPSSASSETSKTEDDLLKQTSSKKYKLTNNEIHVINRAKYEKQLRKNEFNEEDDKLYATCEIDTPEQTTELTKTITEEQTNDIFDKKTTTTKKTKKQRKKSSKKRIKKEKN